MQKKKIKEIKLAATARDIREGPQFWAAWFGWAVWFGDCEKIHW